MVEIVPRSETLEDRVLLLEAAVADLEEAEKSRKDRDHYIVGTLIGIVSVLAIFIVAYVHP